MTLLTHLPLTSTFANDTRIFLQAIGKELRNDVAPHGIPDNLIIANGVMAATMRQTDVFTYGGIRAEINFPSDRREEYWYRWRMMIPPTWKGYSKRITVMQFHDRPDNPGDLRFPNFVLTADDREFTVLLPAGTMPAVTKSSVSRSGYPLILGKWYEFCLHINWQITSAGFREFFIDRVPVFREPKVATEYDNKLGPYFKLGLYDSYHWDDFGTKTAYYSDAQVWQGNDGYEAGLGGVPLAGNRLVEI